MAARTADDVWLVPFAPNPLEHFDATQKKWLPISGKVGNIASAAATLDEVYVAPWPGSVEILKATHETNFPPILRALRVADSQWRAGPTTGFEKQGAHYVTVTDGQIWWEVWGIWGGWMPRPLVLVEFAYVNSPTVDNLQVGGVASSGTRKCRYLSRHAAAVNRRGLIAASCLV